MLIRCRRLSFDNESQFRCTTHNSATNANSLQPTQFRQRITVLLHNTEFGNECKFAAEDSVSAANHKFAAEDSVSAANANLLQPTQFRQRITVSLHNTQFGSEC